MSAPNCALAPRAPCSTTRSFASLIVSGAISQLSWPLPTPNETVLRILDRAREREAALGQHACGCVRLRQSVSAHDPYGVVIQCELHERRCCFSRVAASLVRRNDAIADLDDALVARRASEPRGSHHRGAVTMNDAETVNPRIRRRGRRLAKTFDPCR